MKKKVRSSLQLILSVYQLWLTLRVNQATGETLLETLELATPAG